MWPFRKNQQAAKRTEPSRNTARSGDHANEIDTELFLQTFTLRHNRKLLENFLLKQGAIPDESDKPLEIHYTDLSAIAVNKILRQALARNAADYHQLSEERLIFLSAVMINMTDIITQKTGGLFEICVNLAHISFITRHQLKLHCSTEPIDETSIGEYTMNLSAKAIQLHSVMINADTRIGTAWALATWQCIENDDHRAIDQLVSNPKFNQAPWYFV
jgi:hypothetical protein